MTSPVLEDGLGELLPITPTMAQTRIPLWLYFLVKFDRSMTDVEEPDAAKDAFWSQIIAPASRMICLALNLPMSDCIKSCI